MQIELGRCLLREKLRNAHMIQRELAARTSKSETQISDYISGTKGMSYKTAVEFSQILGCHAEELYEWRIIDE